MLKKFVLGGLAAASLSGAAAAADLPRRQLPPVLPPVPVFTWTGFYAGFNAGYAFDAGARERYGFQQTAASPLSPVGVGGALAPVAILAPGGSILTYNNRDRDGFSGGGQIGYNYQFTPGSGVVVGIEADAQYLDFGRRGNRSFTTNATIINPNFVPVNGGLSTLDFFGTVRGRLGYAFDRTLVYATGGFAYASGGDQLGGFTSFAGRNDDFKTGWAAGGGVEYALPTDSFLNFFRSSAVTIKVEGLYVSLDRNRTNLALVGGLNTAAGLQPIYDNTAISRRSRQDEFAVVRAGLNYKFGTW